jgi:predicted metal-dependent hydrolase
VLTFSWRLVLAPPRILDYLAAHEVAHLKEMNHGPRFWTLVERLHPGHHSARDWLNREGTALSAIGRRS